MSYIFKDFTYLRIRVRVVSMSMSVCTLHRVRHASSSTPLFLIFFYKKLYFRIKINNN